MRAINRRIAKLEAQCLPKPDLVRPEAHWDLLTNPEITWMLYYVKRLSKLEDDADISGVFTEAENIECKRLMAKATLDAEWGPEP